MMKYDKEKKKCEIWGSRVPVIHLFGGWFIGKVAIWRSNDDFRRSSLFKLKTN